MPWTAADRTLLQELHKKLGLSSSDPWNVDKAAGEEYSDSRDIEINLTGDGDDTATETRQ